MTRLLLLPGMDGTSVFYRPFVETCPTDVLVQTFDYEALHATSYEQIVDHIVASLPDEDELFVLGWSFSGVVALKLAARQIPRLRGVILVATFVKRPLPLVPQWLSGLAQAPLLWPYPTASKLQALFQGYSTPALRALQAEAFSKTSAASVAARVRLLLAVDATHELRSCPVPILCLQAEHDRVIHAGHGRGIVAEAPRATLVRVAGPHLCLATHPREAWDAIRPFIRRPDVKDGAHASGPSDTSRPSR